MGNLDTAMRCPICHDYFRTAMQVPACSHTYCSECIRRSLSFKRLCPLCRRDTAPGELVNNRALDTAVVAYKAAKVWARRRRKWKFWRAFAGIPAQCLHCLCCGPLVIFPTTFGRWLFEIWSVPELEGDLQRDPLLVFFFFFFFFFLSGERNPIVILVTTVCTLLRCPDNNI